MWVQQVASDESGKTRLFPIEVIHTLSIGPYIYIVSEWFQVTVLHRPFQILQCLQCEKTEISAWIKHSLNECSKRGSRDLCSYSWFHLSSSKLHDLKSPLCWALPQVYVPCELLGWCLAPARQLCLQIDHLFHKFVSELLCCRMWWPRDAGGWRDTGNLGNAQQEETGGSHGEQSTGHFCSVSRWATKIPE